VLHGCIPVVIMDGVHTVFESAMDWDRFSLRVNQNSTQHLPQLLLSLPRDRVQRMQSYLARVWHRFVWTAHPYVRRVLDQTIEGNGGSQLVDYLWSRSQRSSANAEKVIEAAKRRAAGELVPEEPPQEGGEDLLKQHQQQHAFPHDQDAMATLMGWLYSRIPDTRGGARAAA
jgi:hypothetical protein